MFTTKSHASVCARCLHRAFTSLRHLPPLEKSYPGPVFGCKRRSRGASAHRKTACCYCAEDGVKGHRELDLLGQQLVIEGGAAQWGAGVVTQVLWNIQQGLSSQLTPTSHHSRAGGGQRAEGEIGKRIRPPQAEEDTSGRLGLSEVDQEPPHVICCNKSLCCFLRATILWYES